MQKWKHILDILLISLLLSSCASPQQAPKLPRHMKQFTYLSETNQWCRLNPDLSLECAKPLKEYALYHVDDVAMIQTYILEINERCEKWRVDGHSDR